MPTFPNVPDAPGVPSVPRDPNAAADTVVVEVKGKKDNSPQAAIWGIYDDSGAIAIEVDSIISVSFDGEHDLPTYPIEGGSFETYNKVEVPFNVGVRVTRGGDDATITKFVSTLNKLRSSLDLLTVVTPQYSHASVNVSKVSFDRSGEKGISLITADIRFQQIRETATAEFTVTATPAGADVEDSGAVETKAPTNDQQIKIDEYGAAEGPAGVG